MQRSWEKGKYYLDIHLDQRKISIGYHNSNPHASGGTIWTYDDVINSPYNQETIKRDLGEKVLKQVLKIIEA